MIHVSSCETLNYISSNPAVQRSKNSAVKGIGILAAPSFRVSGMSNTYLRIQVVENYEFLHFRPLCRSFELDIMPRNIFRID